VAAKRKTEQLQVRLTPEQKARIRRASRRAGKGMSAWILDRLLPSRAEEFGSLVRLLALAGDHRPALAELNDFLSGLRPGEYTEAVADPPRIPLPPLASNQLAAMVEQAAAELGQVPPAWTREIEPLREPWFATKLESLRLHLLTVSPPAFRRRNLFVDSTLGDRV
jgi:uncharacterized protein (DUF1778 family)